jgi:hypothetical protein
MRWRERSGTNHHDAVQEQTILTRSTHPNHVHPNPDESEPLLVVTIMKQLEAGKFPRGL